MWHRFFAKFIFIGSLFIAGGCTPAQHETLAELDSSSLGLAEKSVITKNCISCHTGKHKDWANFKTNADWQGAGLVIAGNPGQSALIARLKYSVGGEANMPNDPTLFAQFTKSDYNVLYNWVQTMGAADFNAPVLSDIVPGGNLPSGTTSTTLALNTDEVAKCRYSTTPNIEYSAMTSQFATSTGKTHTAPITGLIDGQTYQFFVRCSDPSNNANPTDKIGQFMVEVDVTPPILSGGSPTGSLPVGTKSANLQINTNEKAACRFSTTTGISFDSMTNLMIPINAGTAHTSNLSSLVAGPKSYFIRCQDLKGNTSTEYAINFNILADISEIPIANIAPTGILPFGTTSTNINFNTGVASTCKYSTSSTATYATMTNTFTADPAKTFHNANVSLANGATVFKYYVICFAAPAQYSAQTLIQFSVAGDTNPPILSGIGPSGVIPASANSTLLTVTTNEKANCRYSSSAGVAYASMTSQLTTNAVGLVHSAGVSPLVPETSYKFYVRCSDSAGNANASDQLISFTVDAPITAKNTIAKYCATCHNHSNWSLYTDADFQIQGFVVAGDLANSAIIKRVKYGSGSQTMPNPVGSTLYNSFTMDHYNALATWITDMTPVKTDFLPPTITGGSPMGILALGTTSIILKVNTNEAATCKYSISAGIAYPSMTTSLTASTDKKQHQATFTGLTPANYFYHVRCMDSANNYNPTDYTISFTIPGATDTLAPIVSNAKPSGVLAAGSSYATLSVDTNESATCRYSTTPGVSFSAMTDNLSASSSGLGHGVVIAGLTFNTTFNFYVRCSDMAGNSNSADTNISFSTSGSEGTLLFSSQESIRISDRIQMKSMYDRIFGGSAATITTSLVGNHLTKFGGPCDPMAQADQKCDGVDSADISAPMRPTSSSVREGQRMKTCNVLTFNDTHFLGALAKITGKSDFAYLSVDPIPTTVEVIAAYKHFYPGRKAPSTQVVDKLQELAIGVKSPTKPYEPWRYVLLTLCWAADWQTH